MHFDIDIELYVPCRYVGHLKERSLKDQMAKDPTEVIRKAVLRMLPRNKLRDVSVRILGFSLPPSLSLKCSIIKLAKNNKVYLFCFVLV
jgi:hypothetical protein